MLKYTGPTGKQLSGDLEKSRSLLGPARLLAQRCMERLQAKGGQGQEFMQQTLADGSTLKAWVYNQVGVPIAKVWVETPVTDEQTETIVILGCGYLETGLLDVGGYTDPSAATLSTSAFQQGLYGQYGVIGQFGTHDLPDPASYDSKAVSREAFAANQDRNLELRKKILLFIPPTVQTGRLRAFVQAKYGMFAPVDNPPQEWATPDLYAEVGQNEFVRPDYRRVRIDNVWLGCEEADTTGLVVFGERYFLVRIRGGLISAKQLLFNACGASMLKKARATETPNELRDVYEAYAFADSYWGDSVSTGGDAAPSVNVRDGWGWRFSWSGQKATCVHVHGDYSRTLYEMIFEYDDDADEIVATTSSTYYEGVQLPQGYVTNWGYDEFYGVYRPGNFGTNVTEDFRYPLIAFYGRSEELTVVWVQLDRIDKRIHVDTGGVEKCQLLGTAAWTRCCYNFVLTFRLRYFVNEQPIFDCHNATINTCGAYSTVEYDYSWERDMGTTSVSVTPTCNQGRIPPRGSKCTRYRLIQTSKGFQRTIFKESWPLYIKPITFIAQPSNDCECLTVGGYYHTQSPQFAIERAFRSTGVHPNITLTEGLPVYTDAICERGPAGRWRYYHDPLFVSGMQGGLTWTWIADSVDNYVRGGIADVFMVYPDRTVPVVHAQGRTIRINEDFHEANIRIPACDVDNALMGLIPDVDFDQILDFDGWDDFFNRANNDCGGGLCSLSQRITSMLSAYRRDIICTGAYPAQYRSDNTYGANGSSFVGWA